MSFTSTEMMTVAAARALSNDDVCFVGIGLPSAACNLAQLTSAPGITLIYESGTIGTKPDVLPLSIGDRELCDTAVTTVPVPEMFNYWLQGGRISVGLLGAAQIDPRGNINTTVIGPYEHPKVRLPGNGGAPEIASFCGKVFVISPHQPHIFVPAVQFVTSFGHGRDGISRGDLGLTTKGPSLIVTDLCTLVPDPETKELTVTSIHPGATQDQVREQTGWPIAFSGDLVEMEPPTGDELIALREMNERTKRAHESETS